MKKSVLFGAIAAGVVLVGGVGAYAINNARTPAAAAYFSAPVQLGDIEQTVLASGTLQPSEVVNVGAQTSGQILELTVGLGDRVTAGQRLGQIDPAQLQNQLRIQENQLNNQRNMRTNALANLTRQRTELARQQALRDQGFGTPSALENAELQVRNQENNLASADSNIRNQELAVEAARNNLERATIRSPIDGIIAEVVSRQGTTVNVNQGVPIIVKVAKLDTMTIKAQVSEADITKVKKGQKVYFTILGDSSKRYYATLRTVEVTPASGQLEMNTTAANKTAVYYNALFDVRNDDGVLLPAMTAEVRVVMGEAKQVPVIPAQALGPRNTDNSYPVQVVEADGRLTQKTVKIGLTDGNAVQVISGLKLGDRVVTGQAVAAS